MKLEIGKTSKEEEDEKARFESENDSVIIIGMDYGTP